MAERHERRSSSHESEGKAVRSLIVFAEDWGRHPSSTQHLVSRLAADRDVIWVNSIGMRRPRIDRKDFRRAAAKIAAMAAPRKETPAGSEQDAVLGFKSVPERLSIVSPRALSWPGSPIAGAFNRASLSRQIGAEIERRSLREPILWTSLPTALPVIGALGERGVAYYCGDDFSALEGVDHAPVAAMERVLSERADIILACSEQLAAQFPPEKTSLVPHGVDVALFQRPALRPADLPAGDRIAGFYGSLAGWIDLDAIASAARALPDWSFVLIGPVRTDISVLTGLPNVTLLGEKPHHDLPAYLQHWTVSLLPFRDTPQIRACNPLKLREYLAVGKPIVTPPFPAMEPYRKGLQVYEYGGDLAQAICLAAMDGARDGERRQMVCAESWDVRARRVSDLLEGMAA